MTDLEQIQKKNWHAIKATMGTYFFVGIVVALLVPDALVTALPGYEGIAKTIDGLVPGIGHLASVSPFPHAMRFFLTVMWLGLPFAAYRVGRSWTFNPRLFQLKKGDVWFVVGTIWLIALFILGFLFFFPEVSRTQLESSGGRGVWFVRLLTQYRLGISVLGTTCFCGAAGTLGIAVEFTRRAICGDQVAHELTHSTRRHTTPRREKT